MSDLISRQAAIDAIEFGITYAKAINKETGEIKELFKQSNDELRNAVERIKRLPSAEPTLYGYKIEHLAYIARVMEKEGITAEDAARTFDDLVRAVSWAIDEIRQKREEAVRT